MKPLELQETAAKAQAAVQKMQMLLNGIAGALNDVQRNHAKAALTDMKEVEERLIGSSPPVVVTSFDLGLLCGEVLEAHRFTAHRKRVSVLLKKGDHPRGLICDADLTSTRAVLTTAISEALDAVASSSRLSLEVGAALGRLTVDVSATGWKPRSIVPPKGSNVAVSVLRSAMGSHLVMSVPRAEAPRKEDPDVEVDADADPVLGLL